MTEIHLARTYISGIIDECWLVLKICENTNCEYLKSYQKSMITLFECEYHCVLQQKCESVV